jgi:hypothetical protein
MGDRLSQDAVNIRCSGKPHPDEYRIEGYDGPGER